MLYSMFDFFNGRFYSINSILPVSFVSAGSPDLIDSTGYDNKANLLLEFLPSLSILDPSSNLVEIPSIPINPQPIKNPSNPSTVVSTPKEQMVNVFNMKLTNNTSAINTYAKVHESILGLYSLLHRHPQDEHVLRNGIYIPHISPPLNMSLVSLSSQSAILLFDAKFIIKHPLVTK